MPRRQHSSESKIERLVLQLAMVAIPRRRRNGTISLSSLNISRLPLSLSVDYRLVCLLIYSTRHLITLVLHSGKLSNLTSLPNTLLLFKRVVPSTP